MPATTIHRLPWHSFPVHRDESAPHQPTCPGAERYFSPVRTPPIETSFRHPRGSRGRRTTAELGQALPISWPCPGSAAEVREDRKSCAGVECDSSSHCVSNPEPAQVLC